VHISESAVEANSGDGIYSEEANLTVLNSLIHNNTRNGITSNNPGEGSPTPASIQLEGDRILENAGTGLAETGGVLTIERTTIDGNQNGGLMISEVNLAITNSAISDNNNSGAGGGLHAEISGGVIKNSTFTENTSYQDGGGMYLAIGPTHTMTLSNVTISRNYAMHSGGGVSMDSGVATFKHVTITENMQSVGGFYKAHTGADATFINSIIAENSGANCSGYALSLSGGHNLDDDNSCGFTTPGDLSGVAPNLGPLMDNGGDTFTHALLPGSPAIDTADDAACLPTDQRGIPRPQGLHCDIGAFEAENPATVTPLTITITPTQTMKPTWTPTRTTFPIHFDPPIFSYDVFYQGGCGPDTLNVGARVSPAEQVHSLGLFYRLVEKEGHLSTLWSEGLAMIPQGNGVYGLVLYAEDLPDIMDWEHDAWLYIQFVANDEDGQPIARSSVYRTVTLSTCRML
jgi:hypothetical protein